MLGHDCQGQVVFALFFPKKLELLFFCCLFLHMIQFEWLKIQVNSWSLSVQQNLFGGFNSRNFPVRGFTHDLPICISQDDGMVGQLVLKPFVSNGIHCEGHFCQATHYFTRSEATLLVRSTSFPLLGVNALEAWTSRDWKPSNMRFQQKFLRSFAGGMASFVLKSCFPKHLV